MSCGLIGILSGAICARRVGNPLTTSCFTVMLHWIYEAFFFYIYFVWGGVGYATTGAGFV
jgi:hypothetical protein